MVDKEKKQILSSLSTANVYRLSRVKVSGTCVQPFQRYWGFGVFWGFGGFRVFWGCFRVLGVLGCFGVFWDNFRVFRSLGCFGFSGIWGF